MTFLRSIVASTLLLLPLTGAALAGTCENVSGLKSAESTQQTEIVFQNSSDKDRKLYWIGYDGTAELYDTLPAGSSYQQTTAVDHVWMIKDEDDACMYVIEIGPKPLVTEIGFKRDELGGATTTGTAADEDIDDDAAAGPKPEDIVSPIETFGLDGSYRLATRSEGKKFLRNNPTGTVSHSSQRPNASNAKWTFEEVPGTTYVRLRDGWRNTYLFEDIGQVKISDIPAHDERGHWAFESVPDEPYVWLISRVSGDVLHAERGKVGIGTLDDSDRSGHWQFVPASESLSPVAQVEEEEEEREYFSSMTCDGGTVSAGKCWCPTGHVRVQTGDRNYECERRIIKARGGCYGGSWIDGECVCSWRRIYSEGRCYRRSTFIAGCIADGYSYYRGRCVSLCPAGTYDRDGVCRAGGFRCPVGTFFNGEGCEPKCGAGFDWIGGWCQPIGGGINRCPGGWDAGVDGCIWPDLNKPGFIDININIGGPPRPWCPLGMRWNPWVGACTGLAPALGINIVINKNRPKWGIGNALWLPPRGPVFKKKVVIVKPKPVVIVNKNIIKLKGGGKIKKNNGKNLFVPGFVGKKLVNKKVVNKGGGKGKGKGKAKGKGKNLAAKSPIVKGGAKTGAGGTQNNILGKSQAGKGKGKGKNAGKGKKPGKGKVAKGDINADGKKADKGKKAGKGKKPGKGKVAKGNINADGKKAGKGKKGKNAGKGKSPVKSAKGTKDKQPPPPVIKQVKPNGNQNGKNAPLQASTGGKGKNKKAKSSKSKNNKAKGSKSTAKLKSNGNAKSKGKKAKSNNKGKNKNKKKAKANLGSSKPKAKTSKPKNLKPKAKKAKTNKNKNKKKNKAKKQNAPKAAAVKPAGNAGKQNKKKKKKKKKKNKNGQQGNPQ